VSQELPLLWTPAQHAWLQAMGCTVFHDVAMATALEAVQRREQDALTGGVQDAVSAATQAMPRDTSPAGETPRSRQDAPAAAGAGDLSAPSRGRADPDTMSAAAPAAPAAPGAPSARARQPAVRLPDRLQMALLRASGLNPNDPDTLAMMQSWPLQALRGNPAAKRALWPTLRALRRRGGGQ